MLSKQFVCGRRSKAVISVLFLLSAVSATLYGGPGMSRFGDDEGIPELTKKSVVAEWCPEEFGGHDPEFLRAAYDESPQDVRYIIEFLKDPNYALGEEDRFSVFYGKPGVGKTVQSLVVPCMAGWRCANRVPSQLLSSERNGTACHLTDDIAKALEPGEKVVYIIQDFNVLVDQQELPERDNDTTAKALLDILDKHNRNPKFYFIGTSSELRYIGRPLKEKLLPHIIEFCGPQTAEEKRRLFKKCLLGSGNVSLSPDCTDEFLDKVLSEFPSVQQEEHVSSSSSLGKSFDVR